MTRAGTTERTPCYLTSLQLNMGTTHQTSTALRMQHADGYDGVVFNRRLSPQEEDE